MTPDMAALLIFIILASAWFAHELLKDDAP